MTQKMVNDKFKIITTLSLLLMITMISAVSLYSGDSYNFEIDTTNELYWDLVGNNLSVDGIEVEQLVIGDKSNVTVKFNLLMESDSFTMVFFDREKIVETITVQGSSSGSGGGTTTKYVYRNVTKYKYLEPNVPNEIEEVNEEVISTNEEEVVEDVSKNKNGIIISVIGIIIFIIGSILILKSLKGGQDE